jgi:hypothetical protein
VWLAQVHSELAPDGYVDADGVLVRAYWTGAQEQAPRLGERVAVTMDDNGRLLAWPGQQRAGGAQWPGGDG